MISIFLACVTALNKIKIIREKNTFEGNVYLLMPKNCKGYIH